MTTQTTLRSLGQKSYVFDILVIVTLMLQWLHNKNIAFSKNIIYYKGLILIYGTVYLRHSQ